MKKLTTILIAAVMLASLSACGEKNENSIIAETTTKDIKKEIVTEATENLYELNYTLELDENVSFDVNDQWLTKKSDDSVTVYLPDNTIMLISHTKDENYTFTESVLVEFIEGMKSDGKISDYTFTKIGDKNAILATSDQAMEYYFVAGGDVCLIMHDFNVNKDLLSSILNSIKINEHEIEKPSDNETEEKSETKKDEDENVSTGKLNALESAKSYIKHSSFSYSGLIGQLEYEEYSQEEAKYGADNCGADWNEEALESAKSYIKHSDFSYSGLYEQLLYEEFTEEQAQYGVDNCDADWMEEAAECAKSYVKHSSFSRQELYDQLIFEGFTDEQAEYGVKSAGY